MQLTMTVVFRRFALPSLIEVFEFQLRLSNLRVTMTEFSICFLNFRFLSLFFVAFDAAAHAFRLAKNSKLQSQTTNCQILM